MVGVALGLGQLHLPQIAYLFVAGTAAFAVYVPVVWPLRHLAKPGSPQPTPAPQAEPAPAEADDRVSLH